MDNNGSSSEYKMILKVLVLFNALKLGWSVNIIDENKIELEKKTIDEINLSQLLDNLLKIN